LALEHAEFKTVQMTHGLTKIRSRWRDTTVG